jgi:hypothetical protein
MNNIVFGSYHPNNLLVLLYYWKCIARITCWMASRIDYRHINYWSYIITCDNNSVLLPMEKEVEENIR